MVSRWIGETPEFNSRDFPEPLKATKVAFSEGSAFRSMERACIRLALRYDRNTWTGGKSRLYSCLVATLKGSKFPTRRGPRGEGHYDGSAYNRVRETCFKCGLAMFALCGVTRTPTRYLFPYDTSPPSCTKPFTSIPENNEAVAGARANK